MTLDEFRGELHEWLSRQPWWPNTSIEPLLGMTEELGELSHAVLKGWQGIRGSKEEHDAAARDAVGDLLVYACGFVIARAREECEQLRREGALTAEEERRVWDKWSLQSILETTWTEVRARDWSQNPRNGVSE